MKFGKHRQVEYASVMLFGVVSNAALGGVALVTAREVTTGLRGQFIIGLAISSILSVFATFGLNISARAGLRAEPRAHYLGSYLAASSLLSVTCALIAPPLFILALRHPSSAGADAAAIFIQCTSLTLALLLVEGIHAVNRHGIASSFDAIGSVSGLLSMIGYLWTSSTPTLAGMLIALSVGNVLQIIICLAVLSREDDFLTSTLIDLRRLFTRSRGNHGTVVGVALLIKMDRYVVGFVLGPTAVSFYATAATVSEFLWLPAQGLANYFYSATSSPRSLERLTRRLFLALALCGLIIGFLSPLLIRTLFGAAYTPSAHLVWLFLPGSLAMTVYFLDSARLMGQGRGRETRHQLILPLVILLVGTSVVAQRLGLNAAAVSCSLAYIVLMASARQATKGRHRMYET